MSRSCPKKIPCSESIRAYAEPNDLQPWDVMTKEDLTDDEGQIYSPQR